MENTSNYGLKRWDGEDRILHTEFNDNWDKIDTALKSSADGVAALQTALASCGNCKIVYGTYTGTDKYGDKNPNTLTFAHKPVFVDIQQVSPTSFLNFHLRLMYGSNRSWASVDNDNWSQRVTWGDKSVQWYSIHGSSGEQQFNSAVQYAYIALLDASV